MLDVAISLDEGLAREADAPAASASPRQTPFLRRALLIIECARALPGARTCEHGHIHLDLSARQFEAELRRRYGRSHPDLVFRADSTFERARLDRTRYKELPRVVLRQGPPPKSERPSRNPDEIR